MPKDGSRRRKKYLGPESDFYDNLKGRTVKIEFNTQPPRKGLTARLDWVDRYTVGIRDPLSGRRSMLFKKSIHTLERSDDDGTSINSGRL